MDSGIKRDASEAEPREGVAVQLLDGCRTNIVFVHRAAGVDETWWVWCGETDGCIVLRRAPGCVVVDG